MQDQLLSPAEPWDLYLSDIKLPVNFSHQHPLDSRAWINIENLLGSLGPRAVFQVDRFP